MDLIGEQLRALRGGLRAMGVTPPPGDGEPRTLLQTLLPDPGALFGQAYSAFSAASGLLGNAVVVFFVGLFAAADPGLYRRGVVAYEPLDGGGPVPEEGQTNRGLWALTDVGKALAKAGPQGDDEA